MFSWLNRWLRRGGVQVSELTFSLPFVQVSLQPAPGPRDVELATSASAASQPGRLSVQLEVTARSEESNDLVRDGLLNARLQINLATEIDMMGWPEFRRPWRTLAGKVQLRPGDIVWLRLCCRNIADRVLYDVPMSMGNLTFVEKLPAIITTSEGYWTAPRARSRAWYGIGILTRAGVGVNLPYVNPRETIMMNCFARVPTKPSDIRSLSFEPLADRTIQQTMLRYTYPQ